MKDYRVRSLSRRRLLRAGGLGVAGAGAAMLFGCGDDEEPRPAATEDGDPPPEVDTVRLLSWEPITCASPLYLARPFLEEEGLNPEYVTVPLEVEGTKAIAEGLLDFSDDFASAAMIGADRGAKVTILAGAHPGCYELFVRDEIESLSDLAGKRIAVPLGTTDTTATYAFMLTIMNYIGIPADRVVESRDSEALPALLQNREVDVVLSAYPLSENLRGLEGVRVALNSAEDTPYSEHYCCVFYGQSEFVRKYPIATKRTLRALLRACDLCANDPEEAARIMATAPGSMTDYETTLRLLSHLDWTFWRHVDPEDSIRFYGLRLRESGELQSTPDELIARSTDFTFLNEVKAEMAAFPAPQPRRATAFNCDIRGGLPLARTLQSNRDRTGLP